MNVQDLIEMLEDARDVYLKKYGKYGKNGKYGMYSSYGKYKKDRVLVFVDQCGEESKNYSDEHVLDVCCTCDGIVISSRED